MFLLSSLKQKFLRVSDCSGKPAKAEAAGAQRAAERPAEATARDHEPHGKRLRTWSEKRDGEAGTPNEKTKCLYFKRLRKQ